MSNELAYIGLIVGLFIVPKVLQRFALPAAITAFVLGSAVAIGAGWFVHDGTIGILAMLGIVSLFLFAGLEVDDDDLRRDAGILGQHLGVLAATVALATWALHGALALAWRPAMLVALALLTPSTGFILSSLQSLDLDDKQRHWIKSKAIASELLALAALFVVLQSTSAPRFALASLALGTILVVLPVLFRLFAARLAPYAPQSEFTFLVILALACAYATKQLGVYYLVGAFVVGMAAQRFREELPAMASERLLGALEVFSGFFVPFYFFKAGTHIDAECLTWRALVVGLVFVAAALPARVVLVIVQRFVAIGEHPRRSAPIGVALSPTLVFTLVLAEIVRERFAGPPWLFGALAMYAIVNTIAPGLVLRPRRPAASPPAAADIAPDRS